MDGNLTPLQRFFLAFAAFFAVLFNRRFAEEVWLVRMRTRSGLPAGAGGGRTEPTAGTPGGARAATSTLHATATRTTPPPQPSPPLRGGEGDEELVSAPTAASPVRSERREAESKGPTSTRSPAAPKAGPPEGFARPAAAPGVRKAPDHAEALHVLSLLQRDGRLIDFLAESLEGFSDAEIGAAARTVHQGCKKALDTYVELEPVYKDVEGATVTVAAGFDPAAVRLTGNVVGAPPFTGALRHHGWRAKRATFPPPSQKDPSIIAPAEVEL